MAKQKRIFREWQHPRADDGRFARKGTASWIRRAGEAFKAATPSLTAGTSAPGRPRIGRAAKGAALFDAHREGARPSAVRAPKKAIVTPAPAVKNLEKFNAPDTAPAAAARLPKNKRPSTFELGPRSKSASGADAAPRKVMTPPGARRSAADAARDAAPPKKITKASQGHDVTTPEGRKAALDEAFARQDAAPPRVSAWGGLMDEQRNNPKASNPQAAVKGTGLTPEERARALGEAQAREAAAPARGNAGFQAIADRAPTAAERGLDTPRVKSQAGSMSNSTSAAPELSDEQRANYDKLLGGGPGEGLVKHKQSRQIVEQLEQHGWTLNGNEPRASLLSFKAPDGREIGAQFLVGEYSSKPRFFTGHASRGRDLTYKAALAHVVTPTHEEVGGGSVFSAMQRLGLPDLDKSYSDPSLKPLRDAQMAHAGYGTMHGPTKNTAEVAADLRKAAEHNRSMADHRAGYNRGFMSGDGEDENSRLLRQRADQFEAVANDMESADTARKAFEVERDRRAGLPLDIRTSARSGPAKPVKKAAPVAPKPALQQVSDRIAAQRGLPDVQSQADEMDRVQAAINARKATKAATPETPGAPASARQDDLRDLARRAGIERPHDAAAARDVEQANSMYRKGLKKGASNRLADAIRSAQDEREQVSVRDEQRRDELAQSITALRKHRDLIDRELATGGGGSDTGPSDIMGDEPSQMDVIKSVAKLTAGTEAPTPGVADPGGYADMRRHTVIALARDAKISVRDKTNTELAAELNARDVKLKAERAAKLNPSGVGRDPGYDAMSDADLDGTLHAVFIRGEGMSRERKLAALAAHDKQMGTNRFAASAMRGRPTGGAERTEVGGDWKGGRRPKGEAVSEGAAPASLGLRETFNQHRDLTRAQFDALSQADRDKVLADLRSVRDSKDQVPSTIASNRSGFYGATIRGTKDAPHVTGAQTKLRELTYTAPPPVDNTVSGRAARLKAGDTGALHGATMAELDQIGRESGLGGVTPSWKRDKAVADLASRAIAGDRLTTARSARTPEALADALRGADPRTAAAVLYVIDNERGVTMADLKAVAALLGVRAPKGTKDAAFRDMAGLAGGALPKADAAPGAAVRAANLERGRAVQREMKVEQLRDSTSPADNAAKIKAIVDGRMGAVDLYRTAHAGPSGQRSPVNVGRVRHTPDRPEGEFRVTDHNGQPAGWATSTVHNGRQVFAVHSENYDGETRLEGWADTLSHAADVLVNGETAASTGGTLDARRVSGRLFERNPNRNKTTEQLDREALAREIGQYREALANPSMGPAQRASRERRLAELEAERRGEPAGGPQGDRTPLDPSGRRAAEIGKTLRELPDDLVPDDQTRRQYVVESKGTWHVGMVGFPHYLQDMRSKREAMDWIVNAQHSRERIAKGEAGRKGPLVDLEPLSRTEFDRLSPTRQREIAARLAAARSAQRNGGDDGGASFLMGKLGLAPTPAERKAGMVTAHPSAVRVAQGNAPAGRISPDAKRTTLARVDTSRVSSHTGGAGNTPTREANVPKLTKAQEPYITGNRVEVRTQDFDKSGFPMEWMAGTVDEHRVDDNGRVDMRVKLDKGGFAGRQIIGQRGGNKNVRPVQSGGMTDTTNEAAPKPNTARIVPGGVEAVGPDGKVYTMKTKRNVNYVVFVGYDDGAYSITLSSAADEKAARAAGRGTNPHALSYTPVLVERSEVTPEVTVEATKQHLTDFERGGPGTSSPETLKAVRDDANAPANWRTQARAELARRGEAANRAAKPDETTLGVTESSRGRTTTVPLGATDADRARLRPRREGESDLSYGLRTAPSDFAAEQTLKGYSLAGLRAIARAEEVTIPSGATKPQIIALLMGIRHHDAISRAINPGPGDVRPQASRTVGGAAVATPMRTNLPAGPAPAATLTGAQLLAQRRAARGR